MKKWIFSFVLALSFCSFAASFGGNDFYVGLGLFSDGVLKVSGSARGEKTLLAPFNYPFSFKWGRSLNSDWRLLSSLDYTLIPRDTAGSGASVNYLFLKSAFMKQGTGGWEWGLGPALIQSTIQGKGGTTVLNNGNSTSTFANPGGTSSAKIIAAEFVLNWETGKFLISQEFIFEQFFSNDRRSLSYLVSFNYILGGGF